MTELWAITIALPHEAKGILARMSPGSRIRYRKIKLYEGRWGDKECVLLQTGMGPENAERSTRFLLNSYPVTHLISTGYCGALISGIENGEAVLATQVLTLEKSTPPISPAPDFFNYVKNKLKNKNIISRSGALITSDHPVLQVEEKEKLGKTTGAIVVDMESFFVLKVAREFEKITSLAIRFVVDALRTNLADTSAFLDNQAGVQPLNLIREMFRKPKIFLQLPGLERLATRARKSMEGSLGAIFD